MERKPDAEFTKNLQVGQQLNGVMFAIGRIEAKIAKNGNHYISLRLGDKTGYMSATVWPKASDEQEALLGKFQKGMVVGVRGRVGDYLTKEGKRITTIKINPGNESITQISKGGYDMEDFRAAIDADVEKILDELKEDVAVMQSTPLKALCNSFLEDEEFIRAFVRSPGAESMHHNYSGGLLFHTYSVMAICKGILARYPGLDRDLLLTGALLHDVGKIDSYEYNEAALVLTEKNNLIGHLSHGAMIVGKSIEKLKGTGQEFPPELENKVLHLILSHHGETDLNYGSAVNPQIPEAVVLFHADNLDSQAEGAAAKSR